jgi:cytoskeletal protein CcmA (bactofilin family)
MFSRNSKFDRSQGKTDTLALPPPFQAPAVPSSLISSDIVVNGDINAVGEIQIDGTVTGNLRAAKVTIGQKATIRGDVMADEIIVRGHVVGTITGRRVQLSGTSYVEGDVRHQSMGMEMGARLDGCCRHAADPLALISVAPTVVPVPKPVSLARAAFAATPSVDIKPAETVTAPASEVPKAKPSLSAAATPVATTTVTPEAPVSPVSDLEALKTTGLKMRGRASKKAASVSKPAPLPITESGPLPASADSQSDTSSAFEAPRVSAAG